MMMQEKLRTYLDDLFEENRAPKTAKVVELKEEILQNITAKYNDLVSSGKSEEAAYNISIAGVGDVSSLINELQRGSMPSTEQLRVDKNRFALLLSLAIGLYVIGIIPVIAIRGNLGPALMFGFFGIATALIVYASITKSRYKKTDDTVVEEFKEWKSQQTNQKRVIGSVNSVIWSFTTIIYFLVSFYTHAWPITWIIFLIGAAITSIVKAIFELTRKD